ncbi:hypothetical protein CDEST_07022 [Colletotrichum destructivum]|uniref:Uncharacterized protein n=1 Tax=Colletotrichum destructivum TaxID=34406 RepID=A0AAX4IEZ4_9PEZI|nr:hypothetical protein CDEST_07022 [Colletotrichum destructivum]
MDSKGTVDRQGAKEAASSNNQGAALAVCSGQADNDLVITGVRRLLAIQLACDVLLTKLADKWDNWTANHQPYDWSTENADAN